MKNTFQISRFGKFFTMELRQFRKMFLILMGITLIDLIMSMATYTASTVQIQDALDVLDDAGMNHPMMVDLVQSAKLGVSPVRIGGAFGFLLLIVPFILYNFVYHTRRSLTYTLLPASWQEKFASAWVMCVIFVPFLLFAFATVVVFVGDLMGMSVSYHAWTPKTFFTTFYLPTIMIQSIAFWGAFWFKRQKIGKTILTLAIFLIGTVTIFVQIGRHLKAENELLTHAINHLGLNNLDSGFFLFIAYGLMVMLWTLALIKFPRTQI